MATRSPRSLWTLSSDTCTVYTGHFRTLISLPVTLHPAVPSLVFLLLFSPFAAFGLIPDLHLLFILSKTFKTNSDELPFPDAMA